jgi:3-mercaptopyruvate sulfurtransferase SseA
VTACVLSLAIAVAEPERWEEAPAAVYDGSWTEWGAEDSGCPVEKDGE